MPAMTISDKDYLLALKFYKAGLKLGHTGFDQPCGTGKLSAASYAAEKLGVTHATAARRIKIALERGIAPGPKVSSTPETIAPAPLATLEELPDLILSYLQKKKATTDNIAKIFQVPQSTAAKAIKQLLRNGARLSEVADTWSIDKRPPPAAYLEGPLRSFMMGSDHTFTFGACGDQHLGSKYERLDVNEAIYDAFAAEGITTVFNTGNWIDGEARFNTHDLHRHGMDSQIRYLTEVYPRRDGITTYAVAGDDHEGWYSQNSGVDIGRYAERAFRDAGRTDWVDLGYMEAPVNLVSPLTGKKSILSVVHPGGGSSYALSYSIQKIIESLDGGEKPAIGLYGHYHKLWSGNIRNVWCVQTGTGQDQTPFMRKKRLEAHVGAYICKATMDPATGAIVRFRAECLRFFNRGYAKNRWSHSGGVSKLDRLINGVAR